MGERPFKESLHWKIVLASVLVEVTMLGLLLVNSARLLNEIIESETESRVAEVAPLLSAALGTLLFQRDYVTTRDILGQLAGEHTSGINYIVVYDGAGREFARAGDTDGADMPELDSTLTQAEADSVFDAVATLHVGAERIGEVRFGLSLSSVISAKRDLLRQGSVIAAIEVLLSLLLLGAVGYFLTRHLRDLLTGTRAVAAGDYSKRLTIRSQDEIGQLAYEFNRMTETVNQRAEALRAGEERFKDFAGTAADWFWEMDPDLRFTYASGRFEEIMGISPEQVLGKTRQELHAGSVHEAENWKTHYKDLEARRAFENYELLWARPDGVIRTLEISGKPIFGESGDFRGYRGVGRDVTAHRVLEQALRDSEQCLALALDVAGASVWEVDWNTGEVLFSSCPKELGYAEHELPRDIDKWRERVHPEDRTRMAKALKDHEEGRTSKYECELRFKSKDGGWRWILGQGTIMARDADGAPARTIGTDIDITERKRAQQRLQKSEASLAEAQRIAGLGNWNWEIDTNEIYWSDEVYRIFGLSPRESSANSDTFRGLVHPEDRVRVADSVNKALGGGQRYSIEYRIIRPDGEQRIVHEQAEVSFDTVGKPSRMVGTAQDITKRTRLEEKTREQAAQLIQANKMTALGTLVSGMAHEINNPTHLVMMNAQMLAEYWADAARILDEHDHENEALLLGGLPYSEMRDVIPSLIDDIRHEAQRIQKIVGDLKNFARPSDDPEAVSIKREIHSEFDLNETVEHALRLLEHRIKQLTESFRTDLAPGLPPVSGDPQKLEQIVINLVGNALEALPHKQRGVTVSTRLNQAQGCVELVVEDEGVGMSKENKDRVFEPFFTTKQGSGGTGLGLAITYTLVKEHGGTISFESEPGKGCAALVRFPAAIAPWPSQELRVVASGQ